MYHHAEFGRSGSNRMGVNVLFIVYIPIRFVVLVYRLVNKVDQ